MGRWGDGLYQSDSALDYFGDISDQVEHELYRCLTALEDLSGRDVDRSLAGMLNAIEILLLFEQHEDNSSASLHHEHLIQSWRETFFKVWDGDWQAEKDYYPHSQPAYRRLHRLAVATMFDRLQSIVRYWETLTKSTDPREFVPLLPDYPLPFFSIHRRKLEDNREIVTVELFTRELIEYLIRDIIYWLSPEKRSELMTFDLEEVLVAVDLLALLCGAFEQTCGIQAKFIRGWRTTTFEIWQSFNDCDNASDDDPLLKNALAAFDRLDAIAEKYPAPEW